MAKKGKDRKRRTNEERMASVLASVRGAAWAHVKSALAKVPGLADNIGALRSRAKRAEMFGDPVKAAAKADRLRKRADYIEAVAAKVAAGSIVRSDAEVRVMNAFSAMVADACTATLSALTGGPKMDAGPIVSRHLTPDVLADVETALEDDDPFVLGTEADAEFADAVDGETGDDDDGK